eukprot:4081438-Pyramimonas_sp.AAC.2
MVEESSYLPVLRRHMPLLRVLFAVKTLVAVVMYRVKGLSQQPACSPKTTRPLTLLQLHQWTHANQRKA